MSRHGRRLVALLCCCLAAGSGCASPKSLARKLNPASQREFDTRLTMAQVHEQEGKLAKAAAIYGELLAQQPKHPKLCHRYGIVQMGLGKDTEGIQLLEQANALNPGNAAVLGDLGYAYLMSGQIEQAETLLRQAYDLEPANKRTVNNLALTVGLAGRYEESQMLYEEVLTPAEAQANLGYICTQRGEGPRALAYYSRALDLDPALKPAAEALVQLHEMKRAVDARQPATAQWVARQTADEPVDVEAAASPARVTIKLTGGAAATEQ